MIESLKSKAKQIKQEIHAYRLMLQYSSTPKSAKFLLGLTVGYLLMPFDLTPDLIRSSVTLTIWFWFRRLSSSPWPAWRRRRAW
jgi:hypothetical protein